MLYAYGIRKTDMVMPVFSFGPWIGFWAGWYACQEIGCLLFASGGMKTDQRINALATYPITVIGSTPSYAIHMADVAAKNGIDLAEKARIRLSWHTGEPGGTGELVLTNLARRATPFIRYRTRDIVSVTDRSCPCERTLFALEGSALHLPLLHFPEGIC